MHSTLQNIIPAKVDTPEPFAGIFSQLGIAAITYAHPSVFTVEEGKGFEHLIPGGHTKNLFLKDKRARLWLITALSDTVIDLKGLHRRLDAGRLSFGNAELLLQTLTVAPGSVTPLALINDAQRAVTLVLDSRLMVCDTVNVHPLRNDRTTGMAPSGLLAFLQNLGYTPMILDFAAE
jgi:Ala-tRNA(Pro) deacylase